jgi:hypothetical protein
MFVFFFSFSDMIGDAMHLDTRASSERSISGGSLSDYPVFRRVEYGYVSIEEIREKLLAARDIRAHRASDPTGRVLPATNRITPIQATIAQRKSETSFSHYLNRPVSVDNLVKWYVDRCLFDQCSLVFLTSGSS